MSLGLEAIPILNFRNVLCNAMNGGGDRGRCSGSNFIDRPYNDDPILDNLVNKCYFRDADSILLPQPNHSGRQNHNNALFDVLLRLTAKCRQLVLYSDDGKFPDIM